MGFAKSTKKFFARGGRVVLNERQAIKDGKPGTALGCGMKARGYGLLRVTCGTIVVPVGMAGAVVADMFTSDSLLALVGVSVLSVPVVAIVCAVVIPLTVVGGAVEMIVPEVSFFRLEALRKEVEEAERL